MYAVIGHRGEYSSRAIDCIRYYTIALRAWKKKREKWVREREREREIMSVCAQARVHSIVVNPVVCTVRPSDDGREEKGARKSRVLSSARRSDDSVAIASVVFRSLVGKKVYIFSRKNC